MTKLHLGCGSAFFESWTNIDYSLGARIYKLPVLGSIASKLKLFGIAWDQRIVLHNLSRPLPYTDNSVDYIYSSHTWEHLRREDGRFAMQECARVLKPGGVVRIVVPSLEGMIAAYQRGELLAENFLEQLLVLPDPRMSLAKRLIFGLFDSGHMHKCMYDHAAMIRLMSNCGLRAEQKAPFDSAIPEIADIERAERAVGQVVVEAIKP